MPTPQQRSRTIRKIFKKLPGGRLTLHYERKKPKSAHCTQCGNVLAGVPRELPFKMRHLGKTEKRPQRIYGGILCSPCMRRTLIVRARGKNHA